MPKNLVRLLAFALIALAVPVQGMAALAGGQCMALGHHDDTAPQGDHHHAESADESHHHDVAHDDGGDKDSHCGPCVSCCASASMACPAPLSLASPDRAAEHPFSQAPPPGAEPGTLDRPPLAL
jgi:hypothetical protein